MMAVVQEAKHPELDWPGRLPANWSIIHPVVVASEGEAVSEVE